MRKMETTFVRAGYVVLNVDYPSRVSPIAELSSSVVGGALEDPRLYSCARIHFVTHSLGGILVRAYFAKHREPRLGRVVMLGPPNQGSEVVDRLKRFWLFKSLHGPAGQELGTNPESVPNTLGPVDFELGVVAGDRSINWINSLMIRGPDDGKVSVERTKLSGMKEHRVVHVTHPFLMKDPQVIAESLQFVRSGSFATGPQLAHSE
jgi:triacylglycerol lipase